MELDGFNDRPIPTLDNPLSREEISRNIAAFSERAKKLSKARVCSCCFLQLRLQLKLFV